MSLKRPDYLYSMGWNDHFENQITEDEKNLMPMRVVNQERDTFRVQGGAEVRLAVVSGKLRSEISNSETFPCVGDWVLCSESGPDGRVLILRTLTRTSGIARRAAGETYSTQMIAANVDHLLIATSLNEDFNLPRLERYLTLAWDSGTVPILVLTKCDLRQSSVDQAQSLTDQFPVVEVVQVTNTKLESFGALFKFVNPGLTAAVVGSSGVGKSTLINHLVGENILRTQDIREDDGKGRHTTTSRNMVKTQHGGWIIDTPGMREIQLLDQESGLKRNFDDVEALAQGCRFGNCSHGTEPGCKIQEALNSGGLAKERWDSYLKLLREIKHFQMKTNKSLAAQEKRKWKKLSAAVEEKALARRRSKS